MKWREQRGMRGKEQKTTVKNGKIVIWNVILYGEETWNEESQTMASVMLR